MMTVPVPEPDLMPAEMIARARALRDLLREEQAETEKRGFYSERIHEEFLRAGFYRCIQPRRFGGYEFDLPTFYRVIMEVSRGCPSTGWCLELAAAHALQLGGLFSEEAQAEAFGASGDFRCPSQAMPLGTALRVDGGWLINGTWPFCSGAPYGTHFMPAALAPGEGPAPEIVYAIIPRSQWTMLDDWGDNILGLCGSGSHSITVKDAIVPEHAVVRVNPLDVDVPQPTVGYRIHGNPMYAGGRTLAFFHGELVSVMIGAARAALDEFERIIRTKNTYLPPIMPRYKHPEFQRAVGLALGMIDAAEAIVLHGAEQFMEYCRRSADGGEPFGAEKDWRLFAGHEHAGRLAWEAMEVLWRNAGSSDSSVHGQRMQRYYRDVSMYRGHFSARFERMARPLGALYLGEPFFELIS